MQIFLDTANREIIKKLLPTGLIDGITTNPTNLSAEGYNTKEILADICAMVSGDVSIEIVERDPIIAFKQAIEIAQFAPNTVVKIPCLPELLPVIKKIVDAKIKVNVTLVFSDIQALAVAKLGVCYISPFVGRWDDIGEDGLNFLDELVDIKNTYDFSANILAASIRSVYQWRRAAHAGVDAITLPPRVFEQGLRHPLSDHGVTLFEHDWKKMGKKNIFD